MAAPTGNSNARKGTEFRDALRKALANGGKSRLPKIAEALVIAAEAGEQWAVKEIADRLDGKPAQAIDLGNQDDNPLRLVTRVELVPLKNDNS